MFGVKMCGIYTQLELVELQDFKIKIFYKNEKKIWNHYFNNLYYVTGPLYSYNYIYLTSMFIYISIVKI